MINSLENLEKKLGYAFDKKELLKKALTHISKSNENNETLFRDTTCKSEDNEGKVFYRVGKSLRGGDGAFLDQT